MSEEPVVSGWKQLSLQLRLEFDVQWATEVEPLVIPAAEYWKARDLFLQYLRQKVGQDAAKMAEALEDYHMQSVIVMAWKNRGQIPGEHALSFIRGYHENFQKRTKAFIRFAQRAQGN